MRRPHRAIITRTMILAPLVALLLLPPAVARGQQIVEESWNRNLMMGTPAGYTHEVVRSIEDSGQERLQTWSESALTIKRMGVTVSIRFELETLEDAETGQIVSVSQVMDFSNQPTKSRVRVDADGRAMLTTVTGKHEQTVEIDWDPEIRGPQYQLRIMREQGLRPGQSYSFRVYTFDVGQVSTQHYEVVGEETVDVLGRQQRLWHLKSSLEAMGFIVADEWRDQDLKLIKSHVVQAGIQMDTVRCSREQALAETGEMQAEVFNPLSPQANLMLPDPYHTDEVLLHIRPLDPELALPDFTVDRRQTVERRGTDGSVDLRVRSLVPPAGKGGTCPMDDPPAELATCLKPSPFLQSDDPVVIEAARKAIDGETDAWQAARLLERFVYEHIDKKGLDVAFATAREVLDTCEGDCSEHGVLLAALCRAVGIPSRVAIGLLYFNGAFGGHMWTEVWIDGDWYALDGTLGAGRVDATHLAMDHTALESTGLADSMTGMLRGLGNLSIRIVEFRHGSRRVALDAEEKPYAIEAGRYVNPINGIALTCPPDWHYTQLDPKGLDPVLVRMEPVREGEASAGTAGPELTVRILYGASDSPLERAAQRMRSGIRDPRVDIPCRIDGRDGRLLAGRGARGETALAYVAVHETAFVFTCTAPVSGSGEATATGDEVLERLVTFLGTVDLDPGPAPAGR